MANRKHYSSHSSGSLGSWLGIAAVIVLLDQVTKITITQILTYGKSVRITSFFNLVLVYNEGAAFSFLSNQGGWQRYFFTGIAIVAAILITYLIKKHADQRLHCWGLTLILGGAVGNLIDRVMYGHVIDFLDFYVKSWHWPAFNVADIAICIVAGLYILDELRRAKT